MATMSTEIPAALRTVDGGTRTMDDDPRSWSKVERAAYVAGLAAIYYLAARLGLRLAFVNASATPVWPPTGIALAAMLLLGYGVWPGIAIGAFLANLATAGTILSSLAIAAGNTAEAFAAAYLITRFAGGKRTLDRAPDIVRFFVLAGPIASGVSATIGASTLALGGLASPATFGPVWLTWWLGDAGGAILVTPALLLWARRSTISWNRARFAEVVLLYVSLCAAALFVFSGFWQVRSIGYPLEFLCTPFLIWAAYRFGQREAATAMLVLASIATWGTLRGFGPFWRESPNVSLLLLQVFNAVIALTSLVLAAVVREREQVEEQLRRLAVTDPLTGLANYRQLMEVLEAEILRSNRTTRPFAVLFLDLDNLKKINDAYGHLTGSRALVRVAQALRTSCRAIDTAARFGGDEFALVLPESDEDAARHVATRIAAELAVDGEQPPVSVSVGVAVHPRDGVSPEALLSSADALLYEVKMALQHSSRVSEQP